MDKIARSVFYKISSNVNGGCFSVSGRSKLEVVDCIFFECWTSQMGGCIFADLNEIFMSERNCFWRCVGETQTHTFRCACPKTSIVLNTLHLCAPSQVGAYGSFFILNSNVLVQNFNCSSCQTLYHGSSGFMTRSSIQVEKQNTCNCTGMGVIVREYCYNNAIDSINYLGNNQTRDAHFDIPQSAAPRISNGVIFGNSRNTFIYGTAPILSNCILDINLQVSNTNCQFGVESPRTLRFGRMNQCRNLTRIFSIVNHLNINFLFIMLHLSIIS